MFQMERFLRICSGEIFKNMFNNCESLSNIKPLKNWNVSNGYEFGGMFNDCKSLSDIYALKNWNVSNGKYFRCLFEGVNLYRILNH